MPEDQHSHDNLRDHNRGQRGIRRSSGFILGGLSGGHGVFHWFTQSFLVMLPEVRETFGLAAVQVGAIATTREVVAGGVALPGGVATDLLRRYWGLVLAACMAVFGAGWLIMGSSPTYYWLLAGMGLVAMAAAVWHLPAVAALSQYFAHRRGTALSFHGAGGNIGDVAGPALTGILLSILVWQRILQIYAVIPLFLAFLVLWGFRDLGRMGAQDKPSLKTQLAQTRRVLKHPVIWGITLVGGLRAMAYVSFMTFLPLYLADQEGLSALWRGIYVALLQLVGIFASPLMGYLSDKLGRKAVLMPGLVLLTVLSLAVPFGSGIALIIIIAVMGTFLFSDQPILTAAALDLVGDGVAATTLGVLSFSRFILSALSPIIGGVLYQLQPSTTWEDCLDWLWRC